MKDPREVIDVAVNEWVKSLDELKDVGGAWDEMAGRGPGYEMTVADVENLKLRLERALRRDAMGAPVGRQDTAKERVSAPVGPQETAKEQKSNRKAGPVADA